MPKTKDDIQSMYDFAEGVDAVDKANASASPQPASQVPAPPTEDADLAAMYAAAEPELKEEKYGGLGQQLKAVGEGAASAATFGLSTGAERLAGVKKEDIQGRSETGPGHIIGQIGGLALTALAPGLGELRAAKALGAAGEAGAAALGLGSAEAGLASRLGAHAARSAFEGALFQGGNEVSKAFSQDPNQTAESAISNIGLAGVLGGVFGGAAGAAEEAFSKAAVEAAPFLQKFKEERAAKALGFTKGQVNKLRGGQNEARDIARTLMDAEIESGEKIFTPLVGAEELSGRVETLRVSAGKRMGDVYEALDSKAAPGIKPLELASKIDEKLGDFWRSPINKGESSQLENILESVLVRGEKEMSFREAQLLKEEVKKVAFPNGKNPLEPSPRVQIAQDAYKVISNEIDLAVDSSAKEIGDTGLLKQLIQAKKEYAAAKKAGKAVADRVSSEQGNKVFGLTDTIAGIGLGSGVGAAPAAAAIVLKKLAEKYGNTALATSGETYANKLGQFAAAFGVGSQATNAAKLGKATVDGFKTMEKAVKSVFNAEAAMPSNVISITAHREKLAKGVEEAIKDPSKLFAINDNNPVEEYSQAFANTAARAVNYLQTLRPNTDATSPLDGKRVASSEATAKYNRALSLAQQPLLVINHIKTGQLTSQDVKTIQMIYPSLYTQLSQKLMNQVIETKHKGEDIPYKTRIGLSLFLGQPLDSSLTPQGILSAQPKPAEAPQQGGTSVASKPPSASSVKGLNKTASAYRTPSQAAEMRGKESAK